MMIIRNSDPDDFNSICNLLAKCKVEPPKELSDLNGICIVAEENHGIVGCVWALIGSSTMAYVDFFAVDPEYRKKHLGWNLITALESVLREYGVHHYTFYVEPDNKEFEQYLEKYREAYGITRLKDLHFYRREVI